MLVVLASAVGFLAWEVLHRGTYLYNTSRYAFDDADEWRYTACSRLVAHGYSLFTQVYSAQPPLLFLSLAGGMRVFGDSIEGARLTVICFGLIALVSAALLAWQLGGAMAAGVCAIVLAVSPAFLAYSHAVEAEIPMAALETAGLAVLVGYPASRGWWRPLCAGALLAAAVLIKLFAVEALLPAALLLLLGPKSGDGPIKGVLLFALGFLAPLALVFGLFSPREQLDQVVSLHTSAASSHLTGLTPVATLFRQFFTFDPGLTLAAVGGLLVVALCRRWYILAFLSLWLLGTTAMLWFFSPLFPHHFAILLPSLAVSTGVGGATALAHSGPNLVRRALVIGGVLAYLALLPFLLRADRHLLLADTRQAPVALARLAEARSGTRDLIAVDELMVADVAHRLVVPPLCDPSNVRLETGGLTSRDLVRDTQHYRPAVVISSRGTYASRPGYLSWLQVHYRAVSAPYGAKAFVKR